VSRARAWSRPFAVFVGVVTVLFLAQDLGRGTPLFTEVLTKSRVAVFASLAKLGPQLLGSIFAARCAQRYEKGNAARPAWFFLSLWLGFWFAGQTVLATYERVIGVPTPIPSLGDVFFTVGYGFVILALFSFVTAYRRSGFAAGSAREDGLITLAACAAFGVVAYFILVPVALSPTPLGERIVNVGYPLLDLVTLIPALVLFRITVGFRGGQVWRVWAALLAGIVFATGGDIVFADLTPAHLEVIGPFADLFYVLGYSFCAYGMRLQYELVAE
jgi:hypothetical protein